MGPHTEQFGLIAPGDWIDFFRYIGEEYNGVVAPEFDNRNIGKHIMGKMMQADRDYDVVFQPKHVGAEVTDFDENDTKIPPTQAPYYLRANTGPRWLAGSVMSRPFITTAQCSGKFAMTSLESSRDYAGVGNVFSRFMTFEKVDHCLSVQEGALVVEHKAGGEHVLHAGDTAIIPAKQGFRLKFASRYVQVFTFSSGDGVEAIIHTAGKPFEGFVIPEEAKAFDEDALVAACKQLSVTLD